MSCSSSLISLGITSLLLVAPSARSSDLRYYRMFFNSDIARKIEDAMTTRGFTTLKRADLTMLKSCSGCAAFILIFVDREGRLAYAGIDVQVSQVPASSDYAMRFIGEVRYHN